MKIGFLSDAHGNIAGMSRCLDYIHKHAASAVFLGDAVGYMPDAAEVISCLISESIPSLMGNHDAMLLGLLRLDPVRDVVYRIEQSRPLLRPDHRSWLGRNLPFLEMTVGKKRILCVHGSPWNPLSGYVYPDSDFKPFQDLTYDAVFMGHTHRPFIRRMNGKLVVNVGSCGLPRDEGSLASCALYDSETNDCEIIRIGFGMKHLVENLHGKIHPEVEQCFLRKSRTPIEGRIVSLGRL